MMLLKGDQVRLHDGRVVEIIDTWGIARCHAKVKNAGGELSLVIAENDVDSIVRRSALRRITKREEKRR